MPSKSTNHFIILQHLSVDVVAGSVAMGILAVKVCHAEVPLAWWFVLPLTVWVMYTLDHLLDATQTDRAPTIGRHLFHRRHAGVLSYWILVLGAIALGLTLVYLPHQIIVGGMLISVIILLYFISLRVLPMYIKKWIPKELIIACIYVGGIFLVPWWYSDRSMPLENGSLIMVIVLLVWSEGAMASWYDRDNDLRDGHHSFATVMGKALSKRIISGVLLITWLSLIMRFLHQVTMELQAIYVVLIVINMGLLLIMNANAYFAKNAGYRVWGEVLFILPVVLVFV